MVAPGRRSRTKFSTSRGAVESVAPPLPSSVLMRVSMGPEPAEVSIGPELPDVSICAKAGADRSTNAAMMA